MARLPKGIVLSMTDLGGRVRALRQRQGISQYKLAEKLGIDQGSISNIERGKRSVTIHQVVRLAKALHASTDDILLGGPASPANGNGFPKDRRLVRSLQMAEKLSKRDRQTLLRSIETFLKGAGAE